MKYITTIGSRWCILILAFIVAISGISRAASCSPGDEITLTRDEPLLFREQVFRQGRKGEKFTVLPHRPDTQKIFVSAKDKAGKQIALSVREEAVALVPVEVEKLRANAVAAAKAGTFPDALRLIDRAIQSVPTDAALFEAKNAIMQLQASKTSLIQAQTEKARLTAEAAQKRKNAEIIERANLLSPKHASNFDRAQPAQLRVQADVLEEQSKRCLNDAQRTLDLAKTSLRDSATIPTAAAKPKPQTSGVEKPSLDRPVVKPDASPTMPKQLAISALASLSKPGGFVGNATNSDDEKSSNPGFEVTMPAPVISSVTPDLVTGLALPGRVNLTLRGANYISKPAIFLTWTGGSATLSSSNVTFVSSSRLEIAVVTNITADKWTVIATNPDGQKSNTIAFRVVAPAPANISGVPNGLSNAKAKSRVAEHLVKGSDGLWLPEPGYDWANPNDEKDKSVVKLSPATDRISSMVASPDPMPSKLFDKDKHARELLLGVIKQSMSEKLQEWGIATQSFIDNHPEIGGAATSLAEGWLSQKLGGGSGPGSTPLKQVGPGGNRLQPSDPATGRFLPSGTAIYGGGFYRP